MISSSESARLRTSAHRLFRETKERHNITVSPGSEVSGQDPSYYCLDFSFFA
jgi:hypothetical protein